MKKKVQIFLVLALLLSLSFSSMQAITVSANDTTSSDAISFLEEIGAPDDFIQVLPEEQREYLYNRYKSQAENLQFGNYTSEVVEIKDNNDNVQTRGQISTSKLRLTIDTINLVDSNNKVGTVYADACYEWLEDPILHWTDAHTFNFDSSLFYVTELYGFSMYKLGEGGAIVDEVTTPAAASDGGIGWYLSIARGSQNVGNNFGGGSIVLKPNSKFTVGTKQCNMYYTYGHQIVGASISLSPSGPSVNISSGSYDYQTVIHRYS